MAEVAVYFADPDAWTDAALAAAVGVLCASERERAASFRFERDRRLYVVAHGMLRRALSEHTGASPSELGFRQNAHGRPELEPESRTRFSLAHAAGMTVCVITTDHDVGVDVEPLDRPVRMAIAERWFAARELADMRACSELAQAERFYTYWTLKEAYVKARGIGLALGIQNVGFELSSEGVRFLPEGGVDCHPEEWRFHSFRLGERHQAALALRAPTTPSIALVPVDHP